MKTIRCFLRTYGDSPRDWYRDVFVDDVPTSISGFVLQADPPIELTSCGGVRYVLEVGSSKRLAFREFYIPYWHGEDFEERDRHFFETLKAHGWTNTPRQSEETQA